MKGKKSLALQRMKNFGIPVPDFSVVQYGESVEVDGGKKYAVRSSPYISMAGILDSILDVDGEKVPAAIEKVFASWNTPFAVKYRNVLNIPHNLQMEVIVQEIVNPKVDGGFAGIIHSTNPVTGIGISGSYVDGEFADNLCKGGVNGNDIKELSWSKIDLLKDLAYLVEAHEGFPQDIEYVYNGRFWLVQTRPAQLTDIAFFRWVFSNVDPKAKLAKFGKHFKIDNCVELISSDIDPIAKCVGVSGNIVEGVVGKDIKVMGSNVEEFPNIANYNNIILVNGNINNHFAVEARKAKKNCVIWPNPYIGSYVWIDVQSGYVFDRKPNAVFENKLKNLI